jgi:hypothetical protein
MSIILEIGKRYKFKEGSYRSSGTGIKQIVGQFTRPYDGSKMLYYKAVKSDGSLGAHRVTCWEGWFLERVESEVQSVQW